MISNTCANFSNVIQSNILDKFLSGIQPRQMIAREAFIEFSHCVSFRSYDIL